MDLADMFRMLHTDDEDVLALQVLGIRNFNAFAASLNLAMSGYTQNSALVLRDVLETVFLLDMFRTDRALVQLWRLADKKTLKRRFSPFEVRKALDARDGVDTMKRAELYELFSELAAHPNAKSSWMLRSAGSGEALLGPFVEKSSLEAILGEMGRLAIQVGDVLVTFLAEHDLAPDLQSDAFLVTKRRWMSEFYSSPAQGQSQAAP